MAIKRIELRNAVAELDLTTRSNGRATGKVRLLT